jgi:hypothetical protein
MLVTCTLSERLELHRLVSYGSASCAYTASSLPSACFLACTLNMQTFPMIPAPGGQNPQGFSDCARKVLAVKPKKGTGRSQRHWVNEKGQQLAKLLSMPVAVDAV